jgi:SAM-dependent methyltransferase
MLYFYGLGVGLESIARGRFSRETLKNVVVPENYWRSLENRLTYRELNASSSDTVLDLGSPKLLSLYLADRVKAEVFSTGIDGYFLRDYAAFGRQKGVPESRFHVLEADGRKLPFPDNHFTRAYSISVLEHIPGTGDMECAREIGRTLKRGGICVVTVPFSPVSSDEYRKPGAFYWAGKSVKEPVPESANASNGESIRSAEPPRVFYQRRYSESDLHDRLIGPSGLRLKKAEFMGDRVSRMNGKEIAYYIPRLVGPLHPILSRMFHATPSESWKEMKNPLGALLVLEKP